MIAGLVYPVGGTLTQCDLFGIPSTSHWTGAAIIAQCSRTKTCIVTRSRASPRPTPSRGHPGKAVQQLEGESGKGLFVAGVTLPLALAEPGLIDENELVDLPSVSPDIPRMMRHAFAPTFLQNYPGSPAMLRRWGSLLLTCCILETACATSGPSGVSDTAAAPKPAPAPAPPQAKYPAEVEQRIERVIRGLLPSTERSTQLGPPADLAARMRHYHTPGVSIAVINEGKIEWARAFGVRDSRADEPIGSSVRPRPVDREQWFEVPMRRGFGSRRLSAESCNWLGAYPGSAHGRG